MAVTTRGAKCDTDLLKKTQKEKNKRPLATYNNNNKSNKQIRKKHTLTDTLLIAVAAAVAAAFAAALV